MPGGGEWDPSQGGGDVDQRWQGSENETPDVREFLETSGKDLFF